MASCLYSLVFPIHGLNQLESVEEEKASHSNLLELSLQPIQKNLIIFGEDSL
jgi:hypothetical protein